MTLHLEPPTSLTDRIRLGPLTRKQIAEFVGVSRQLLGRWEHGAKIKTVRHLTRLAEVLVCEPDDLPSDLRGNP